MEADHRPGLRGLLGADGVRLKQRLAEAAERGADLAVLPEIPLNPWSPATKEAQDDDAEPMDGPARRAQAEAAAEAGIGLVGGIIHRAEDGRRTSRALVIDAHGEVRATYEKLHLPEEPGFWETSHYEPGTAAPGRIDAFGVPIGVQICSDNNRPEGTHLLGAQGAMAMLNPRATEEKHLPAMEDGLPRERADELLLRPVGQPAVPRGGGPDRRTERGHRPDRRCARRDDRSAGAGHRRRHRRDRGAARVPRLPARAGRLYAEAWGEIARSDG